jgi:thiol-disulfide isomerase/thioredoxin
MNWKKILLVVMLIGVINTLQSQQIKKVKIEDVKKIIDTSTVPLVVNFWATWCKPCVHELPGFEKNIAAMKDKKVKLLLVSLDLADDYPKGIAEFLKKNNYTAQTVWLNETDAASFCPVIDKTWEGTIPATIMVNNKKHYRKFFGQQLPEPRLQQELQLLVE